MYRVIDSRHDEVGHAGASVAPSGSKRIGGTDDSLCLDMSLGALTIGKAAHCRTIPYTTPDRARTTRRQCLQRSE